MSPKRIVLGPVPDMADIFRFVGGKLLAISIGQCLHLRFDRLSAELSVINAMGMGNRLVVQRIVTHRRVADVAIPIGF